MQSHSALFRRGMSRPFVRGVLLLLLARVGLGSLQGAAAGAGGRVLVPPSPEVLARIEAALPERSPARPASERRVLVFSRCEGAVHAVIPTAAAAFRLLGSRTGAFTTEESTEMSAFAAENLAVYDAVLLNNTTRLAFTDPAHRLALMDFVRGGKGLIGSHAATDNFPSWPEGVALIGGQFDGHPWTARGTWAVKIDDPTHPLNLSFGGKGFRIRDEIYQIKGPYSRETHRVLLSLDLTDAATAAVDASRMHRTDGDFGISWLRREGRGRVFYCSLGHNPEVFLEPAILAHYLAGIQYALGDLVVDDRPSVAAGTGAAVPPAKGPSDPLAELRTLAAGSDRAALHAAWDLVRTSPPEEHPAIEARLIEVLEDPAATAEGRDAACRLLLVVGGERAIAPLGMALADPTLSTLAAHILAEMPVPAAGEALRTSLERLEGVARLPVLKALARRRDVAAIPELVGLAAAADGPTATTAVRALGGMGLAAAPALLELAVTDTNAAAVRDARLACAGAAAGEGSRDQALALYRAVLEDPGAPLHVRSAALAGLTRLLRAEALGDVLAFMAEGERQAALGEAMLAEMPGEEIAARLADRLPALAPGCRARVLAALGRRGEAGAFEAIASEAGSADMGVRSAALRALAELGDPRAVPLLVRAHADPAVASLAREALAGFSGAGVDETLLAALGELPAAERTALVPLLAERQCVESVGALTEWLGAEDEGLRIESWRALGTLAPASHAEALLLRFPAAVSGKESSAAEGALARCLGREADDAKRVGALLAAVEPAGPAARAAALRVLAQLGGTRALEAVAQARNSPEAEVSEAAMRALAAWSTPDALPALRSSVETAADTTRKTLAFRGYVRLLGVPSERPAAETLTLFREALDLTPAPGEANQVLAGLGNLADPGAVDLAVELANREELRAAAVAAAVSAAARVPRGRAARTAASLRRLLDLPLDDATRGRIIEAMRGPDVEEGWLVDWQLCGPFGETAVAPEKLFEEVFPPESDPDSVSWVPVQAGKDAKAGWVVNLEKVLGGTNRVAYVRTHVHVPDPTKATLELGSDDGVKVWLNGALVHRNDARRAVKPAADKADVTFQAGWNSLLVKVTQIGGHWGMCARIRPAKGTPLPELLIQPEPPQDP
ncbi:MAG: ThuA domain-containing protein [Lentisphaeria bacterium]|nr:ThuA domain-containing protein [Lentisphaeria bacterium]